MVLTTWVGWSVGRSAWVARNELNRFTFALIFLSLFSITVSLDSST